MITIKHLDKHSGFAYDEKKLLYRFDTYFEEIKAYFVEVYKLDDNVYLIHLITLNETLNEGCDILVRKPDLDHIEIEVYEPHGHWKVFCDTEGGNTGEEISVTIGFYHGWVATVYLP